MPTAPCFHCTQPSMPEFTANIQGEPRLFCCAGCQAITMAIVSGGLENFYNYRDGQNVRPEQTAVLAPEAFGVYDLPKVQADFVRPSSSESFFIASLNIEGITCAACVWLIEKHLLAISGVVKVNVNASSHQGRITFDSNVLNVSDLFYALARIGFKASPSVGNDAQASWQQIQRTALLRLGVAGLGMMQAGMVAIALHAGALQGITGQWEFFLRCVSLLFATPVLFYSGFPFFSAAYRSLKLRHLTMDVPVSLALILAFSASVWATLTHSGEVYFDSVSMFIFFLLLGRYLEQRVRYNNFLSGQGFQCLMPVTATRVDGAGRKDVVPLSELSVGERLWVASGDTFPCDGCVLEGSSSADESLLTGESLPRAKAVGDKVVAGSQNIESGLIVQIQALGSDTRLAEIERLVEQGLEHKPSLVAYADRIASYFVLAVLLVSIAVAGYWLWQAPDKALWITLSVLVVTCPCALSLATPTASASASNRLRELGLLVTSGEVIEALPQITDVVFDKTGTLTQGCFSIMETQIIAEGLSEAQVLSLCASLQQVSSHPIAKAFDGILPLMQCAEAKSYIGLGVAGVINQSVYRLGKPVFACPTNTPSYPGKGLWLLLSENEQPVAWLYLADNVRDSASEAVALLRAQGINVHCLSGDRAESVAALSVKLGFDKSASEQSPSEKLAYVQQLQDGGANVLMVGDGINDVPVLASATISIAMAGASDLAKLRSSSILLANDLCAISSALSLSIKTKRIIWQNLAWALIYNASALPLAACGFIPPWLAAIGMSLSSLVVVINALRLRR